MSIIDLLTQKKRKEQEQKHIEHEAELIKTKDLLEKKIREIEEQNKFLEDTKKAMLNLLDDEKRLEEALEREKKNVEVKVEERTRELKYQQARFLASINSVPTGFMVTDLEGKIITTNIALAKIFDSQEAAWSLENLYNQFEGIINLKDAYKRCLASKEVISLADLQYKNKYLKVFMAPVYLNIETNEVIGTVILIEDISEAKILERAKDEFFSIASHELRTPLTALRGNISLIKEYFGGKLPDPEFLDMLNDSHNATLRLIEIVNDFLTTSRLEQGRVEFKKDAVDLKNLVEKILKSFEAQVREKNIITKFTVDSKTFVAEGDSKRVEEVLINLVANSIKFTEFGSITISITQDQKEQDFLRIRVTDTGKGIPIQNQALLFRKFQQAGGSIYTRDSTRGTGLGLYISKLMIEAMGGKIYLEYSEEDKGTTFSFTIPVSKNYNVL